MSSSQSQGCISSELLQMLLSDHLALTNGSGALLRRAGIDPSDLQVPYQRIPVQRVGVLWDEIERGSGDPHIGLHLGALRKGLPAGHVLFSAMLNCPTVGHALTRYCRYHDIMGDVVWPRVSSRGGSTVVTLETTSPTLRLHPQHVECVTSLFVAVVRHLAAGRFEGDIHFRHAAPPDPREHRRVLGASVLFGQPADEIVFSQAFLETPIPRADPELLAVLEQHAATVASRVQPERPWSTRVAREVVRALCDGKPHLGEVARRLALSGRGLQNRLEAEGTSYQAVVDSLRRQMAESYLGQTEMSVSEIAFLLGFSDQSAFTHAFRKWTATSPASFRRERQSRPGDPGDLTDRRRSAGWPVSRRRCSQASRRRT